MKGPQGYQRTGPVGTPMDPPTQLMGTCDPSDKEHTATRLQLVLGCIMHGFGMTPKENSAQRILSEVRVIEQWITYLPKMAVGHTQHGKVASSCHRW